MADWTFKVVDGQIWGDFERLSPGEGRNHVGAWYGGQVLRSRNI